MYWCSWYMFYSRQLCLWASHALPAPTPLARHLWFIKIWTLLSIRLGAHKLTRISCSNCHTVSDGLLIKQKQIDILCLVKIITVVYLFHPSYDFFLVLYVVFGDSNLIYMHETHGFLLLYHLFVLIMHSICYSMTINLIWNRNSRLNTCLQCIAQRQLQDETRNIQVLDWCVFY